MAEEPKNQNQIAKFDQKLALARTVTEIFGLPDVKDRFIKNYQAVTGRTDGANRLEQERFAYLELLHDKPELKQAPNWSHFSALVKAATTGLSFRDNKLYVQAIKQGDKVVGLKVSSSPAGKREQFEMMATVKEAPEAQVVVKGDLFIEDKLNHCVIKHESTEKSQSADKLEHITHSYQRIIYKNGEIKDVVVPYHDLLKAKSKSKIKSADAGVWNEFPAEAAKKTATNRAFRLYHKYPDNVVHFDKGDGDDEDETTNDVSHTEISYPDAPAESFEPNNDSNQEPYDRETGEVHEPEVIREQPKREKVKKNLLDD